MLEPQHAAALRDADARFLEAYEAVHAAVTAAFADLDAVVEHGMVAWKAKRPVEVSDSKGTYDPKVVFVGLGDRKAGPTLHLWHPGHYTLLDDNAAWLQEAGFKVMRGCLPWVRRGPYPKDAVHRLLAKAAAVDR